MMYPGTRIEFTNIHLCLMLEKAHKLSSNSTNFQLMIGPEKNPPYKRFTQSN